MRVIRDWYGIWRIGRITRDRYGMWRIGRIIRDQYWIWLIRLHHNVYWRSCMLHNGINISVCEFNSKWSVFPNSVTDINFAHYNSSSALVYPMVAYYSLWDMISIHL